MTVALFSPLLQCNLWVLDQKRNLGTVCLEVNYIYRVLGASKLLTSLEKLRTMGSKSALVQNVIWTEGMERGTIKETHEKQGKYLIHDVDADECTLRTLLKAGTKFSVFSEKHQKR